MSGIADWFAEHQLDDGGWNCEWVEGSTRSSFHSTLNSLKGILGWEIRTGDDRLREVRHRGEQYLLTRRLLYRASTGEKVGPWVDLFGYPFRHVYTALNALDYLRRAFLHDGVPPDERAADAVAIVRNARQGRRHVAAGQALCGRRVVRDRRARRRAVAVADVLRDAGARLVGGGRPRSPVNS